MSRSFRQYLPKRFQPLVYLWGPILGYDYFVRESDFEIAEQRVRVNGYRCFNPMHDGLSWKATEEQHLKKRLEVLIKKARYYCFVPPRTDKVIKSDDFEAERMVIKEIGITEFKIPMEYIHLYHYKRKAEKEANIDWIRNAIVAGAIIDIIIFMLIGVGYLLWLLVDLIKSI